MAKNLFNSIQLTKPKKNVFDLTHDVKLTGKMGELIPVCTLEAVPGDKFNIAAETIVRFAPLIAPVMHRFDLSIHYFFVPNRLLWTGWEEFITGKKLAVDGYSERVLPTVTVNPSSMRLAEYLGCPRSSSSYSVNAMPFAAYLAIYNEYYRDQNLISEKTYKLGDGLQAGPTASNLLAVQKRAWEHDYFSAALPFAQKGDAVTMPLGTVQLDPNASGAMILKDVGTGGAVSGDVTSNSGFLSTGGVASNIDPNGNLIVESTAINDLRRAFRLQEWLEKNARAGTRYVENILAHFGVKSSDARLQRPEYIVGVKSPIVISEVLNTTGEQSGLPQGNMAGHGVGVADGRFGGFFCEEHGYIMGIMSVMPKPAYMQGIPKHFLKNDRLDFFWPEFSNIGEQEVVNAEIYVDNPDKNGTFGYVPRYAEYKYQPNRVAGDFLGSLEYWHLARKFNGAPALNQTFVECVPDTRIFAVEDEAEHPLYINVLNKIKAVRPMPKFGTPQF